MYLRFESTDDSIIDIEEAAILFAEDVRKADDKIRIFSGECHAGLYSNKILMEALRWAHREKEVSIDIISSPIISTLVIDNRKYSGLLKLWEEGVVTLRRRRTRGNTAHYKIIDESFARVEQVHDSLEELQIRKSELMEAGPWIKQFESYKDLVPSKDPWKDFLILSPVEIESLRDNCCEYYPERSFYDLDIDDLKKVLDELQSFWDLESKNQANSYKDIKSYLDKIFATK